MYQKHILFFYKTINCENTMNSKHLTKGAKIPSSVSKGKIRLYNNRFCPYSQRIILMLDAKQIPYEIININIINKPEWMYDKTPKGKIPAIELDTGDILYESEIIAEFLNEKYTENPLHSKDPLKKAKDLLLLRQFTTVINAMLKTVYMGRIGSDESNIISEGLKTFENELERRLGPFFGGNKPRMLDYMIWPWCERAESLKIFGKDYVLNKNKYKRLMEWKNFMKENEVVKKSFLNVDTHMKYMQSYRVGAPDYDSILTL